MTALVKREDGRTLTPADQARVATLTGRMADWRPQLERDPALVRAHRRRAGGAGAEDRRGPDRRSGQFQLVGLQFRGNSTDPRRPRRPSSSSAARPPTRSLRDDLKVGFTGGIAGQTDYTDSTRATTQLEGVLLLAAIALLTLVVFRGVLSTVVPTT